MARKKSAPRTTKKIPSEDDVIQATFVLLAEKGLGKARLSDLALRLGIPLAELYKHYPSIDAILAAFISRIDQEMIQNVPQALSSKRDAYFDMIMTRMDMLQNHRPGIVRWLNDLRKQPTLWAPTLKRWEQSLSLMLDIAKDSPLFPVKKLGLAGIYVLTLRAWLVDDSADLSRTMATLDQALGKAEAFGDRFLTHRPAVKN